MSDRDINGVASDAKLNKVDHDYMHTENMRIIFESLRSGYTNTKRGIQKHTGLSWGTVSVTINELLEKGMIVNMSPDETQNPGRPSMSYQINNRDNLLIGVDINVECLRVIVTNLEYEVLFSKYALFVKQDKDFALETVSRLIDQAITFIGPSKHILGIGFALMGAVDRERGVAIFSQHIQNWKNVDIKAIFEEKYSLPVIVEHDPNCAAITEMAIGKAKNYNNVLLLRLSVGIGMSIVINGEIYHGANGNAGEFGHMCYDPNGPICSCGHKGCIEAYASIAGIANRYRLDSGVQEMGFSDFYKDINIVQNLAILALAGDETTSKYFVAAGRCLGRGISAAICFFNPDVVVLSGMLMKYSGMFMNELNKAVHETVWGYSPVNILISDLTENATAIGAAAGLIQTSAFTALFE